MRRILQRIFVREKAEKQETGADDCGKSKWFCKVTGYFINWDFTGGWWWALRKGGYNVSRTRRGGRKTNVKYCIEECL